MKNYKRSVLISNCLLIIFCAVVGGVIGSSLSRAIVIEAFNNGVESFRFMLIHYAPYISMVINIVAFVLCFSIYFRCKNLAAKWDGEDEEIIDRVESGLSLALAIGTIAVIISYMLVAIGVGNIQEVVNDPKASIINGVPVLFCVIWAIALQYRVVSLRQKINQENNISVFDIKFNKKYFESRDEGQKMVIYRASYDVYKSLLYINLVMFLIAFFGMSFFHTGILPIILVCGSWLAETIIFFRAEYKYRNMK